MFSDCFTFEYNSTEDLRNFGLFCSIWLTGKACVRGCKHMFLEENCPNFCSVFFFRIKQLCSLTALLLKLKSLRLFESLGTVAIRHRVISLKDCYLQQYRRQNLISHVRVTIYHIMMCHCVEIHNLKSTFFYSCSKEKHSVLPKFVNPFRRRTSLEVRDSWLQKKSKNMACRHKSLAR